MHFVHWGFLLPTALQYWVLLRYLWVPKCNFRDNLLLMAVWFLGAATLLNQVVVTAIALGSVFLITKTILKAIIICSSFHEDVLFKHVLGSKLVDYYRSITRYFDCTGPVLFRETRFNFQMTQKLFLIRQGLPYGWQKSSMMVTFC